MAKGWSSAGLNLPMTGRWFGLAGIGAGADGGARRRRLPAGLSGCRRSGAVIRCRAAGPGPWTGGLNRTSNAGGRPSATRRPIDRHRRSWHGGTRITNDALSAETRPSAAGPATPNRQHGRADRTGPDRRKNRGPGLTPRDLRRGGTGAGRKTKCVPDSCSTSPLPESCNPVGVEDRIGAHDRHAFDLGLCHEEAVERIPMMPR